MVREQEKSSFSNEPTKNKNEQFFSLSKNNNYEELISLFSNVLQRVENRIISNITQINQNNVNLPNTETVSFNSRNLGVSDIYNKIPIFDNQIIQPMEFLEQLEYFYNTSNISFESFKYGIRNNFKNEPALWQQAYLHTFNNFEDFKQAFKEHFWSETRQLEIRLSLQSALYCEGSFVNYFMRLGISIKSPSTSLFGQFIN